MARVPEGKRIRSVVIQGTVPVPTADAQEVTLNTYVFQDDVKIVGVEIQGRWSVDDTASNTDGYLNSDLELTRSARRNEPSSIIKLEQAITWNGILSIGSNLCDHEVVMYPDGTGVEIDEGEYVNLLVRAEYIGSGSLSFLGIVIVYWVER